VRLAIVTTEYPPFTPDEGGIGTLYAALVPKLRELGNEMHVFAHSHDRDAAEERDGVRLHHVRPPARWIGTSLERVAWSSAVARAVRAEGRFDLVWAPEWTGGASAYSRRKDAGPLVTHLFTSLVQVAQLSGGRPREARKLIAAGLQNRLERRQAERSDALLAQSQAILDWARRLWDIGKLPVRVLPSVLDVPTVRALGEGPEPDGVPESRPRVVFFGRLEHRKGLDVLVRAMPFVWDRFPSAPLVVLGNGNDYLAAQLRELAEPRVDRLHMLGHRPSSEVFPVVRSADVVVLPSRWENFALSALEAMALGRPVVLTTAGGAPEFCRDGHDALLVPPEDPGAIGAAIRRVLEDPALGERLGREAASTAERFDVSAVAPRYLEFFEELA
jgi:glycogen(starch) synthase